MKLIQETEPALQALQSLPKILTEMIEFCGQSFFPIPDSTLAPLLEVCWKCRNEPRQIWESSFRKVIRKSNDRYLKFMYCINFTRPEGDQPFVSRIMAIILLPKDSLRFCPYAHRLDSWKNLKCYTKICWNPRLMKSLY